MKVVKAQIDHVPISIVNVHLFEGECKTCLSNRSHSDQFSKLLKYKEGNYGVRSYSHPVWYKSFVEAK